MPTIEEMSAWSDRELSAEILNMLPEGWFLKTDAHTDGYWSVSVDRAVDSSEPVTEFFESHIDKRIALLNIYGALVARKGRETIDPNWVANRHSLTKHPVSIKSSAIPDPEDLDPLEVESVYLKLRGKSNKS